MNQEVQIQFKRVVEQIFSNWTGLQMAVEHSMAGPNSRIVALQTVDHICNFCFTTNDIEAQDICDELEDILDEEFDTICEDNSPNDVAQVIWRFLQLLKQGNVAQFQTECNNLPPLKTWLNQIQPISVAINDDSSNEDDEQIQESSMEVDPEWTVVKTKRKK